ncbi:MAG: 23S rRNA (guanosine(2251)-2'-O)-methyltransferase RlmB [Clostridia bacterium]|nr:23S rRNA (guanosine(2251)-2'-O)-methyltransferase RlmB [Clostridia bacterium]
METKKKNGTHTSASPRNGKGGRTREKNIYQPKKGNSVSFERREKSAAPTARHQSDPDTVDTNVHGECESGAVIGRNAVRELLRSDRSIDKLMVQRGERTGSIVVLVAEAIERGIPVIEVEKTKLDDMAGYAPHQGVIALAAEKEYCTVEDILDVAKERGEAPLIVICDGITDPYNLGAVIRCAECCGAHGLIIPKRRAVGLTPLVTKASAGAIEHLAIAKVSNVASTVDFLKKKGIWTYAAEAGGINVYDVDFKGPCAIVMGSEGNGVSQLVKKTCDGVVSIPMYGKVNSFNVSTAAAILLAEVARQQHSN